MYNAPEGSIYRLRQTVQWLMITIIALVGALKQRAPIQGHLHIFCPNMLIPTEYASSLATTLASRSSAAVVGPSSAWQPLPHEGCHPDLDGPCLDSLSKHLCAQTWNSKVSPPTVAPRGMVSALAERNSKTDVACLEKWRGFCTFERQSPSVTKAALFLGILLRGILGVRCLCVCCFVHLGIRSCGS
jgi:hypothetical protein